MLIRRSHPGEIPAREITDEALYLRRREFLHDSPELGFAFVVQRNTGKPEIPQCLLDKAALFARAVLRQSVGNGLEGALQPLVL